MLCCVSAKEETTCCPDSKVTVYANGTCMWYREFRLSVSHCQIDIAWFPFDSQVCGIIYESKSHDSNEMNISRMAPEAVLDSYNRNGEWELLGKLRQSTTTTWKPSCACIKILPHLCVLEMRNVFAPAMQASIDDRCFFAVVKVGFESRRIPPRWNHSSHREEGV